MNEVEFEAKSREIEKGEQCVG